MFWPVNMAEKVINKLLKGFNEHGTPINFIQLPLSLPV